MEKKEKFQTSVLIILLDIIAHAHKKNMFRLILETGENEVSRLSVDFMHVTCKIERISCVQKYNHGAISRIGLIMSWIVSCGQNDVIQILHCNSGNPYCKLSWNTNISILRRFQCIVAQVVRNGIKIFKYCYIADNILQYPSGFSLQAFL